MEYRKGQLLEVNDEIEKANRQTASHLIFQNFLKLKIRILAIHFFYMKKLLLIRHAKSSWDLPLRDFDRPLMKKGIQDANNVFSKIVDIIPQTFIVWSSAAKRAAETALLFAENISIPVEDIQFKEELYTFDGNKLEKIIKSCPNDYENLILFGHNSAITDFVNKFGDIYIDNVPTAGFVSIIFETNDWNSITKGKTVKTLFPRDC